MDKPPAFQFYPADFLADENVILMSNQEVGCYIKLMCFCWREGSIPAEIDKIARLCQEDSSAMAQLWLQLSPCFKKQGDRLVHPRLEKERQKQDEFRKNRQKAGKKGAAKRWTGKPLNGTAKDLSLAKDASSSSSLSLSSSSPTGKENIEGSKDPLSGKPDPARNGTPPYQEIIGYLNERTGKKFDHRTKETQRHIKARWNAGHDLDAFKRVIDNKVAKWATDPKFVDFLRPVTLFGTKFESYLNEKPHPLQGKVSEVTMHNIETFKNWEPPS